MLWLIIGYMYLFIHRPSEIWSSLGGFRIELIYMVLVFGYWLTLARKQWLSNRLHGAFILFFLAALLCWLLSSWPEAGVDVMDRYYKLLVFYLLLVTSVRDEDDLRRVVVAYLAIMAIYMSHSLLSFTMGRAQYRQGLVRLIGIDTTMGDPNSFGACVLNSLVFVIPLWHTVGRRGRACLVGYSLLGMLCIALTGSRTSFAALVVLIVMVCAASKRRWQMAALALVLSPLAFMAMPAKLQDRFETIVNPDAGPKVARDSAEGRLEGFSIGVDLFARYPVSGCGPGAWKPSTRRDLESHNLYGQIIGEMGLMGIATFGFVLLAYGRNVRRIANLYRLHPEWGTDFLAHMGRASGFVIILLLVEGVAGHTLFRFSWLWYGAFLVIARHCVEERCAMSPERSFSSWRRPELGRAA